MVTGISHGLVLAGLAHGPPLGFPSRELCFYFGPDRSACRPFRYRARAAGPGTCPAPVASWVRCAIPESPPPHTPQSKFSPYKALILNVRKLGFVRKRETISPLFGCPAICRPLLGAAHRGCWFVGPCRSTAQATPMGFIQSIWGLFLKRNIQGSSGTRK